MVLKHKSISCIIALVLITPLLNGCVSTILVPVALNLAAEGFSIQTTGQTITENLKEALLGEEPEQIKSAAFQYPALPPRKPEAPRKKPDLLAMTEPTSPVDSF